MAKKPKALVSHFAAFNVMIGDADLRLRGACPCRNSFTVDKMAGRFVGALS